MTKVPESARALGYAGLLPQAAALLAVIKGGPVSWTAMALAYGYAALIFSFIGGAWWGIGLARAETPRWIFLAAVMPSLIGLALWFPWMEGWSWPGPELIGLGALIAASPLVDLAIGFKPDGWMRLRRDLSIGLGSLTIAIGFAAQAQGAM
ncbi:DUF3429 family protein [Novosphingobium sp. Chol11]|uniref:DUF3429 family protein n=1 Tax=Novosphingobium sp. Chol11 TaxID=1385763 RepID=UPI0025D84164|nr:DUF3429 family protein [Novosphingobium sp. Chol11]